jgi:hypothetical protein
LNNFPLYEDETRKKSLENLYLYSSLQIGPSLYRPFLAFPSTLLPPESSSGKSTPRDKKNQTMNSTLNSAAFNNQEDQDKYPLKLKFLLLPGLYDLNYFHEILQSNTFNLQIHQEDLCSRCFFTGPDHNTPKQVLEEYLKLVSEEPGGLGLPVGATALAAAAAAAPAGKGKGAGSVAANKNAVVTEGPFIPVPTKILESDKLLIKTMHNTLSQSKMLRSHGSGRFRMEQLLSKSNDLLAKFKSKRNPDKAKNEVSIKEAMVVPIRLEKPTHPERWDLPEDMSLKKALTRAKELESELAAAKLEARNNNNNNNTLQRSLTSTSTSSGLKAKKSKPPPRVELFLSNNTNITVKVKLTRSLDPQAHTYDSDLPMVHKVTLQDPKMTIKPDDSDFNKTVRLNEDNLLNLTETDLQTILSHTPFTRMIIRFQYQDDDVLRAINEGINTINHLALPNIQGTIRSYALDKKEREDCIKGKLDVISGFMILDDDQRLVVLEGLAKPYGSIHTFYSKFLPKVQDNNEKLTILCNPTILFPDRLYPDYCPDLKRIRIRNKLKTLSQKYEIYNRKQVDVLCFQGIDLLMNCLRVTDLKTSKLYNIYPSAESLNKLELLYGEAITRADMDGTLRREFLESAKKRRKRGKSGAAGSDGRPGTSDSKYSSNTGTSRATTPNSEKSGLSSRKDGGGEVVQEEQQHSGSSSSESEEEFPKSKRRGSKLPFTDCWNPEFDQYLASRPHHRVNHLAEHSNLRKDAYLNMLFRRQLKQAKQEESIKQTFKLTNEQFQQLKESDSLPPVFPYSNQSENYKIKLLDNLREQVRKDYNTVYTMSPDFVSQTICVIDEDKYQKAELQKILNPSGGIVTEEQKSHWLTQKGFLYPKPKTFKEIYEHSKRPNETRIEDLKEPFTDILDQKKTLNDSLDMELVAREKSFKTQFHLDGLFGGLEVPKYSKDFELKNIGNATVLPRGDLVNKNSKNTEFFQSVFCGGEKQQLLMKQAAEEEQRQWESKVVVENKSFVVGHFVVHDKPLPFQRTENILHDPPKKGVLKDLYEKKGFQNTPLSILSAEPYLGKNAKNVLGRESHPEKFMTATHEFLAELEESRNREKLKNEKEKDGEYEEETAAALGKSRRIATTAKPPQDFVRYLNPDTIKNDLNAKVAKRKHPPLDKTTEKECTGPKWLAPSSTSSY